MGATHIHILFGGLICFAAAPCLFLKHHFLCLLWTDEKWLTVSFCHWLWCMLACCAAGFCQSILLLLCATKPWLQAVANETLTITTKSSMCRKLAYSLTEKSLTGGVDVHARLYFSGVIISIPTVILFKSR